MVTAPGASAATITPMKVKTGLTHAAIEVKAAGPSDGLKEGQFKAYASIFGNVDSYGDIVVQGAFKDTLADWAAKDAPIPLLWGHDMYDPFSNLGGITEAEEDSKGLLVTAQLDLENPTAVQVYRMMKGKRVTDMSFAYTVESEKKSPAGNQLLKLGLIEVSVVPIGANRETEITAIKAHLADLGVKAGRVLSATNEATLTAAAGKITEALADIESVLVTVANTDAPPTVVAGQSDQPKSAPADASGTHEDKADTHEDPSGETRPGKGEPPAEDPKAGPSVDTFAATFDIYALV